MAEGDGILLRLFGRPEAHSLRPGKAFADKGFQLVALAALSPQRRIARKTAAIILWDQIDEAGALNNLRQLLTRMRQQLPDLSAIVTVDAREITIAGEGSAIDLCRFVDGDGDLRLSLYQGTLLEGLGEVSQTFADWLHIERTQLQEQFFRRCEHHLLDITRFGRCSADIIAAFETKLLALEPEREASFRLLIEVYGRAGHAKEAARLSRTLVAITLSEHGSMPQRETEATVRRVLATAVRPEPPIQSQAKTAIAVAPRVAFLQPRWLTAGASGEAELKALIEDVVNELSRYNTFVMLAPYSSFQIDHDSGLPLDNKTLCADYTISGFMKPDGSLSLRMVHFQSEAIVWAGEFTFDLDDLLRNFRILTLRIAKGLAGGIESHATLSALGCSDNNAYVAYLQGRDCQRVLSLASVRRARKKFLESAANDDEFGSAKARAAETLFDEWTLLGGNSPELLLSAKQLTQDAMKQEPNSAIGYWIDGLVLLYQRNFDWALERFDEAAILAPNSADLLVEHANALAHVDLTVQAIAKFELALSINPFPPDLYWRTGAGIYFNANNMEKAISLCENVSNDEGVLRLLAASHALLGEREKARTYGDRLKENYPGQTATDMVGISPDKNPRVSEMFLEGLRRAGIK